MSATLSTMLPLGTPAPAFSLPDVTSGRTVSLADLSEKRALLVVFLCAHCPYVHHVRPELARLGRDYAEPGRGHRRHHFQRRRTQYPEDAPESTARFARDAGFTFPILYDESQAVAKAYTAACTPDFFLFDGQQRLAYRGQLDASRPNRGADRPGGGENNGADLRAALEAILAGEPVNPDQRPSVGCSIKWKR